MLPVVRRVANGCMLQVAVSSSTNLLFKPPSISLSRGIPGKVPNLQSLSTLQFLEHVACAADHLILQTPESIC